MHDPRRLAGLLLIAGGVLWALVATTELGGTIIVPGGGIAFLAGYLATRQYGLLIPGGILTVVGASRIAGIRDIGLYLIPIALIVVGLLLLLKPARDRRDPAGAQVPPTDDPHHASDQRGQRS